jgi:hypothetical protein
MTDDSQTDDKTAAAKKDARNRFWGRALILAMGALALAQIIPTIWRWFAR